MDSEILESSCRSFELVLASSNMRYPSYHDSNFHSPVVSTALRLATPPPPAPEPTRKSCPATPGPGDGVRRKSGPGNLGQNRSQSRTTLEP